MTFKQWLYGNDFNNPKIDGQWGTLHIITLIICVLLMVGITLLFRKKDEKTKRIVLIVIASILLFFEITRRIINITNPITFTKYNLLWVLLPRPGCAISVWLVILAPIIHKKWFYNFTSMISIICALIFFAYPGAGFNNQYILFENLCSIVTHSLFFIGAIVILTLNLSLFNYKNVKNELISLACLIIYCVLEMFVLTKNANKDPLEADPFYILPNNEVQEIVSINNYTVFLILYILFFALYFASFYLLSIKKIKKTLN